MRDSRAFLCLSVISAGISFPRHTLYDHKQVWFSSPIIVGIFTRAFAVFIANLDRKKRMFAIRGEKIRELISVKRGHLSHQMCYYKPLSSLDHSLHFPYSLINRLLLSSALRLFIHVCSRPSQFLITSERKRDWSSHAWVLISFLLSVHSFEITLFHFLKNSSTNQFFSVPHYYLCIGTLFSPSIPDRLAEISDLWRSQIPCYLSLMDDALSLSYPLSLAVSPVISRKELNPFNLSG